MFRKVEAQECSEYGVTRICFHFPTFMHKVNIRPTRDKILVSKPHAAQRAHREHSQAARPASSKTG